MLRLTRWLVPGVLILGTVSCVDPDGGTGPSVDAAISDGGASDASPMEADTRSQIDAPAPALDSGSVLDSASGADSQVNATADGGGTCVPACSSLPHVASAACQASTCVIQSCAENWEDADGKPETGCESQICDNPGCPASVERASLQLWLRGDRGLTCDTTKDPQRVTKWEDQSGRGRHAAVKIGQLGPYCGANGSKIDGKPVPFFPAASASFDDDTLTVDLSFLVGADFTIFVVERRQARLDPAVPQPEFSYMIGSELPQSAPPTCGMPAPPSATDHYNGFYFGYRDTGYNLKVGRWTPLCDVQAPTPTFDPVTKPTNIDVGVFSKAFGTNLFINGKNVTPVEDTNPITSDDVSDKNPITVMGPGYIGRAYQYFPALGRDTRFLGDIAEIVIYNKALTEQQRTTVQGYLKSHWSLSF